MKERINKLKVEQSELIHKMNKLHRFRGSDEWKNLSMTQTLLLDVQLSAMKTYLEALTGRIIDLETNEKSENKEDPVKVIIVGLGE